MSNIVPYQDMERMADAVVKSNLFGIKTQAQAIALMSIAAAEGKHPAQAAMEYHVIQGRPALKADSMLARFQHAGGVVQWDEYTDAKVSARFSHPTASPKPVSIEWTIEQAKRIGLSGKEVWKQYPRAMLRARVISEGVRTVYPGIAVGVYSVEEVQDMTPERVVGGEIVTPVDAESLIQQAQDAITLTDLEATWKVAVDACRKAGDMEAHKRIKEVVLAKKSALAAPATVKPGIEI